MAMKGTSFSHTFEMTFTPPKMTTDTMMTMAKSDAPGRHAGQIRGDDLGHGGGLHGRADAEGRDGREQGKSPGAEQRPPGRVAVLVSEAALPRVHGAAEHVAVVILHAVLNGSEGLGVLRGDAEHAGDPHPEHRARAARDDGRAHADDVAGADSGGKSRAQGAELADVAGGVADPW